MFFPAMRPVALVLASAGLLAQAQAGTYTVPQGAVAITVTAKGAGGGAGGADEANDTPPTNGAGGVGSNGALLVVRFDGVTPGQTATYIEGQGGASGTSWNKAGVIGYGGALGAGDGTGGKGGDAPLANFSTNPSPDPESGSGGGGGGGGASSFELGGLWVRAGGGGGGGGGSWARPAFPQDAVPPAADQTNDCKAAQSGVAGEDGTGTRTGVPNRGGGGGGGGGGGYAKLGAIPTPAAAGWDGASLERDGAHSGAWGLSCYSDAANLVMVSNDPVGGAPGSTNPPLSSDGVNVPPPADPGENGSVTMVPIMDKSLIKAEAGDATVTLDAPLPPSVQDASQVTGYSFTCNPALGGGNPLVVSSVPTAALPATNDTAYTCTVVVTVKDPNGGPDLPLLPSDPVTVTPKAGPVTPPIPSNPTPVPGLGGAGLVLLTGLLGLVGLRRKRY